MTGLNKLDWEHIPAPGKSYLKESLKVPSWGLSYSMFFINDIFHFIVQYILYNYSDDNTLSYIHKDLLHLKSVLEQESLLLIQWFDKYFMKANADKFQAICIGKNLKTTLILFKSVKQISNVMTMLLC